MDDEETLAAGERFAIVRTSDGFSITYDDEVAHEHDALVEAVATDLVRMSGVAEVLRDDREVLRVRTTLDEAELVETVRVLWREAAGLAAPTGPTVKEVASAIAPQLKAAGFRRRGNRWNREPTPGLVHVVEVGRQDDAVVLHFGVYVAEVSRLRFGWSRPAFVDDSLCQVRLGPRDLPPEPPVSAFVDAVEREVLPTLDRRRVPGDLLAPEVHLHRLDRAILLRLEGDRRGAQDLLQKAFDEARARRHVHEVTARCGLDPLVVGSSPVRSRAEDDLLTAWTADARAAVARLRRRTGLRLDGSLGSLDEIDRILRPLVERAQREPEGPPTTYAQVPRNLWGNYRHLRARGLAPLGGAMRLGEELAAYLRLVAGGGDWILDDDEPDVAPAVEVEGREPVRVTRIAVWEIVAAIRPPFDDPRRRPGRPSPLRAEMTRRLRPD
jgi:hypothetical protein